MPSGFKVWATGDLVNASDFNNYIQEQVIMSFADSSARGTAISSPEEGMFAYLKDTNVLTYYDGSSWASYIGAGDITGVTITTASNSGLAGGAASTSGAFSATMTADLNNLTAASVNVANDSIAIIDADASNGTRKESIADLATAMAGTNITASSGQLSSAAGGVALQVVYQQTQIDLSSSATEIDITGLDITITPAGTGSAVMVGIGSIPIQVPDRDDNNYWGLKIDRAIGGASASTIYTNSQMGRATSTETTDFRDGQGFSFIDKPNTTSECVYEFIFICDGGGATENASIGKDMICTSYGIEYSSATEV